MTTAVDEVEDVFRGALEKDAAISPPSDVPAPPRKSRLAEDPDAPHGRAEDGTPHAPYGIGKNGRPRIKPAGPGRGNHDKPRTTRALPPAAGTGKPATEKPDYSGPVGELADGFWMLMSGAPLPVPKIQKRLHAQAAILKANKPGLVNGISAAAQNNDTIAAGIEKLTTGNVSWILPAMFALTPFVAQSVYMWRAPLAGDVEALADHNKAEWDQLVQSMTAQMGAAASGEAEV